MSELGYVSYEEAPSPLTDTERRLLKRMFSDYFEVPSEWKAALKADLERDPPILGKATLGSGTQESKIPLESMASSGMIGQSGVTIGPDPYVIKLGTEAIRQWGSGGLSISSNWLYFGPTQNLRIGWDSGSYFRIFADNLMFGATGDARLVRSGPEEIAMYNQRLALRKTASGNGTPLILNCGGTDQAVYVSANDAVPGGRVLYVPNA